ncbi:MAG: hypothetical protein AAGA62_17645, partial [Bacteroidota bacterium]
MRALSIFLLLCLFSTLVGAQNPLRDAELLSADREYAASSALLTTFIEEHPQRKYDLSRAYFLHSYNLLQLGQLPEAREANTASLELRRRLRSENMAENYLRDAQISLQEGDGERALMEAQSGMQMLIDDPVVYADLNLFAARALTFLGRYDEGWEYLRTAQDVLAIELGEED